MAATQTPSAQSKPAHTQPVHPHKHTQHSQPALPGFAAASRSVVAAAAHLVGNVQRAVVGPANVPTARDNAWAATLADRARNEARAELTREVAAIVARRSELVSR